MTIDERIESLAIAQARTQRDLQNLTELVRQLVITVSDHEERIHGHVPLDHEARLKELERWRMGMKEIA